MNVEKFWHELRGEESLINGDIWSLGPGQLEQLLCGVATERRRAPAHTPYQTRIPEIISGVSPRGIIFAVKREQP